MEGSNSLAASKSEEKLFNPDSKALNSPERESSKDLGDTAEDKDEEGLMKRRGKKLTLSTTSSVFAEHTISNPNNDQVKYW
jgi:hypothetical protein